MIEKRRIPVTCEPCLKTIESFFHFFRKKSPMMFTLGIHSTKVQRFGRTFISMMCLALLGYVLSGCTSRSPQHSSPSSTRTSPSSTTGDPRLTSAEGQLLATVKNAEMLGPGNPLLLSSLYSLATFYGERKEYAKASAQYERALQLKEEASGRNHPDVAAILRRYARLLEEAGRPAEAEKLLLRADAILAQSSPPLPLP